MKKTLAIFLVLTMLLCMFTGCGNDTATETSEAATEEVAPAATEETTEGASAETQTDGAIDYSDIKIGLLLNSTLSDGAWSQAVGQSLLRLQEEIGLTDDQIIIIEGLTGGGVECDSTIAQLVDDGCNIIFGASSLFLTNVNAAYPQYPDVYFAMFEGNNDANCCSYTLWDIEGMFMCGYAGALLSESNELGFVASQPQASIVRAIDAYAAGAKAANPDATVEVIWVNSWYDPAGDKECAGALIDKGITVIGNVSTVAVLEACEEGGAYTNGYYVDLHDFAPGATVTSFVWNFAPVMKQIIDEVATDSWTAETKYAGMAEGAVELAPWNTDIMSQEDIDKCDQMYDDIINGDYAVMEGPLYDNEGNEVLAEGDSFTLEEWTVCYFLLDNVIGDLP